MKSGKIGLFTIILMCCFLAFGCSKKDDVDDNVFMTVDGLEISPNEAKFYAYNKQANYEVYYLANGFKIDWNAPYDDDTDMTMEDLVKKEVLAQMKELILVSEYAKEQGVKLDDEDLGEIDALVDEFISDSKNTLLDKTGKDKDVLKTVFTRQKYVDKLYEKLQIAEDENAKDKLYKELLSKADIKVNDELWDDISFDEAIYTSDDVEVME